MSEHAVFGGRFGIKLHSRNGNEFFPSGRLIANLSMSIFMRTANQTATNCLGLR